MKKYLKIIGVSLVGGAILYLAVFFIEAMPADRVSDNKIEKLNNKNLKITSSDTKDSQKNQLKIAKTGSKGHCYSNTYKIENKIIGKPYVLSDDLPQLVLIGSKKLNALYEINVVFPGEVNTFEFDYDFISEKGAEGYATVFIDGKKIRGIDERISLFDGFNSSQKLPIFNMAGKSHLVGFRIDSYTDIESRMIIKNLRFYNFSNTKGFGEPIFVEFIN